MTQSEYRNKVLRSVIDQALPLFDRAINELSGLRRGRKASRRLVKIRERIAVIDHCQEGGIRKYRQGR